MRLVGDDLLRLARSVVQTPRPASPRHTSPVVKFDAPDDFGLSVKKPPGALRNFPERSVVGRHRPLETPPGEPCAHRIHGPIERTPPAATTTRSDPVLSHFRGLPERGAEGKTHPARTTSTRFARQQMPQSDTWLPAFMTDSSHPQHPFTNDELSASEKDP